MRHDTGRICENKLLYVVLGWGSSNDHIQRTRWLDVWYTFYRSDFNVKEVDDRRRRTLLRAMAANISIECKIFPQCWIPDNIFLQIKTLGRPFSKTTATSYKLDVFWSCCLSGWDEKLKARYLFRKVLSFSYLQLFNSTIPDDHRPERL